MADPMHIGQLFATHPISGAGGIGPNDLIKIDRAISSGNPAAGVNSYGARFSDVLSFLAGNLSGINFPVETYVPALAFPGVTFSGVAVSGYFIDLGNVIWLEASASWSAVTGTGAGAFTLSAPRSAPAPNYVGLGAQGISDPGTVFGEVSGMYRST